MKNALRIAALSAAATLGLLAGCSANRTETAGSETTVKAKSGCCDSTAKAGCCDSAKAESKTSECPYAKTAKGMN